MLTATRGRGADWTDWASYAYLALGTLLMFGPVLWLVLSLVEDARPGSTSSRRRLLPYEQARVAVPG